MSERFVITQNVERFRRLLAGGSDGLARGTIATLLAEEEDKLAKQDGPRPEGTSPT